MSANILEPNWERAKSRIANEGWGQELITALEKDVIAWSKYDIIPSPSEPSGWTHHYFCSECGEPLVFNPDKPKEHLARECNKTYCDEHRNAAWRTLIHNTNAVHLERCAVLFRLGIQQELAKQNLLAFMEKYPEQYPYYEIHGHSTVLAGRMLPQTLDEAIWTITFLRSLRWSDLRSELTAKQVANITKMVEMVVELLQPSIAKLAIHNISCWMLACLAECAFWLNDQELLKWCWDNPSGIDRQLHYGLDADGQWHEGSTHYHYYAMAALFSYFEIAGPDQLTSHLKSKLELAMLNPVRLRYSDGRMPAYNDAWPNLNITDNADLYEVACNLLSQEKIEAAMAEIYQHKKQGKPRQHSRSFNPMYGYSNTSNLSSRASVAALLFGPDITVKGDKPDKQSFLLPYSGIGVLRNDKVRLAMRFGPYGGWHDHCDKLNVDIEKTDGWQSLDLGTSGYGVKITNAFQRTPAAHNTVMIDGTKQDGCIGHLKEWSQSSIIAETSSAYEDVVLQRSLRLGQDSWDDTFEIKSKAEHRIDWIFHGDGCFVLEESQQKLEAVSFSAEKENGLAMIDEVKLIRCPGLIRGSWLDGNHCQGIEIRLPDQFNFYFGIGSTNPNGRPIGVIIVRGKSACSEIRAKFFYEIKCMQ